jgi:hypothetical protein
MSRKDEEAAAAADEADWHARIERLAHTLAHHCAEEAVAREQVDVWLEAVRVAVRDGGPLPPPGARNHWRACADKLDAALIALESLTRRRTG